VELPKMQWEFHNATAAKDNFRCGKWRTYKYAARQTAYCYCSTGTPETKLNHLDRILESSFICETINNTSIHTAAESKK